MSYEKNKHLEFIQNIITRMNSNSFQIKTWTISIITGLLAIYAATKDPLFILICLVPISLFWILDSYYLTQERRFRELYNDIAMDTKKEIKSYQIDIKSYYREKHCFWSVLFSFLTALLYLPLAMVIICLFIYVR